MDTIEQQLRTFIARDILFSGNGYPYADEDSFLESGVVDSMNVMEIVLFAEKAFGIPIEDREIVPANFDSIRNLADFVRRKKAEDGTSGGEAGSAA
jgi:acyl carrier protein